MWTREERMDRWMGGGRNCERWEYSLSIRSVGIDEGMAGGGGGVGGWGSSGRMVGRLKYSARCCL